MEDGLGWGGTNGISEFPSEGDVLADLMCGGVVGCDQPALLGGQEWIDELADQDAIEVIHGPAVTRKEAVGASPVALEFLRHGTNQIAHRRASQAQDPTPGKGHEVSAYCGR